MINVCCRKLFIAGIGEDRPQLLIYDAATCHMSLDVVKLAIEENVAIISLPAKTTAFLQPVDQILSVLDNKFGEVAYKCSFTKMNFLVRPANFPPVLSQSIALAWTKDIIETAFKNTGIVSQL